MKKIIILTLIGMNTLAAVPATLSTYKPLNGNFTGMNTLDGKCKAGEAGAMGAVFGHVTCTKVLVAEMKDLKALEVRLKNHVDAKKKEINTQMIRNINSVTGSEDFLEELKELVESQLREEFRLKFEEQRLEIERLKNALGVK